MNIYLTILFSICCPGLWVVCVADCHVNQDFVFFLIQLLSAQDIQFLAFVLNHVALVLSFGLCFAYNVLVFCLDMFRLFLFQIQNHFPPSPIRRIRDVWKVQTEECRVPSASASASAG